MGTSSYFVIDHDRDEGSSLAARLLFLARFFAALRIVHEGLQPSHRRTKVAPRIVGEGLMVINKITEPVIP